MNLIDGKKTALVIYDELRNLLKKAKRPPGLAFILVGDNSASKVYVKAKQKTCADLGIESTLIELVQSVGQDELIEKIHSLNDNPRIDGILVQLPLPAHINDQDIMLAIDPKKDVDGFHPVNVGKMLLGSSDGFIPCTPGGVQELLKRYNIEVRGKHVVILGRSNIVGKPLGALLVQKGLNADATVTIAHSQTKNLSKLTKSADILIAAIGKPHFVTKDMVQEGAVVIDVGINRLPDGSLAGDVDFANVHPLCSWITPVPGGVGPMTIAMLMKNTCQSYLQK